MSGVTPTLTLALCEGCQLTYLPGEAPCPRCGARRERVVEVPGLGVVLAATELQSPAAGWPAPHRIALVEITGSVRLLGVVDGGLPSIGDTVEIRRDGAFYRLSGQPGGESSG